MARSSSKKSSPVWWAAVELESHSQTFKDLILVSQPVSQHHQQGDGLMDTHDKLLMTGHVTHHIKFPGSPDLHLC